MRVSFFNELEKRVASHPSSKEYTRLFGSQLPSSHSHIVLYTARFPAKVVILDRGGKEAVED